MPELEGDKSGVVVGRDMTESVDSSDSGTAVDEHVMTEEPDALDGGDDCCGNICYEVATNNSVDSVR